LKALRWLAVAVATFEVTAPERAFAYRPFDGTDADVAAHHEIELEIGTAFLRNDTARFLSAPALVANYGFLQDWELVVEGHNAVELESSGGGPRLRLEGPGTFLKSLLRRGSLQGQRGLSVAVETGVLWPSAQESGVGAELTSIFSQRLTAITLHLNVGNEYTRSHTYALFLGTILEGPEAWAVRPVAELFVEREFGERRLVSGLTESALIGLIWQSRENLSFDIGARAARGQQSAEELRAGLTWSFEL